jgi:Tfp pilus assembly protein PilF
MPYAPPRQEGTPEQDYEKYKDAVAAVYEVQDEIIGEMMSRCGPNTVIMIASDHGFKSGAARLSSMAEIGGGHAALWHKLDGVICLYGHGIRPGSRIENASVLDITPTILALSGLPQPGDMPGKVLEGVFEPALLSKLNRTVVASLERDRPHENPALAPSRALDEAELKRLEALGYITPENPDALNNLGQRLQKQGKYEQAIVEFEKAIELRPNFSKALNNLGTCYGDLERYPEAEQSFMQALELNPRDIYAMNNLAVMYLKTQRLDRSIEWGNKAVAIEPKYINGHITLGSAYATRGELDLAEQHFRTALEMDPDNRTALINLNKLEQQKRARP